MTSIRRVAVTLTALAAACGGSEDRSIGGSAVGESDVRAPGGVEVSPATHHDVSGPLRDAAATPAGAPAFKEHKVHPLPQAPATHNGDPALQASVGPLIAVTPGLNFAGVGNGDYGFAPNAAPPDTNGAVGATQYVQWVNESFAVFSKTGALLQGPTAGNTVWSGFGGGCESNNDGDPIVKYDRANDRWILSQFSVSTTPYLQCVAVSTTGDATGTYNRYSFSYGNQFPDYPKLGVWPDGYYITYNIFNNGQTFAGSKLCVFDRVVMLVGGTATQQCFQLSTSFGGVLPSDLDGATAPPAGSPNYLMNFGTNSLNLWRFHADFVTPANTTLTGPVNIPVQAFTPACSGGACIPQPNTRQKLDTLADRLMYRLAYRNFGTSESLVVNQSVQVSGNKKTQVDGIRWYEVTSPDRTPVIHQQGTYSPNSTNRWMGSIAMDKVGDIAVGYSASSSSVFPSIRYTGRVPTDPLGTMQAENIIKAGGGSQLSNLSRWGDYSSMTVDPVDDCTFWYTTEYLKSSGTFNWSTWISSFKFPGCQ